MFDTFLFTNSIVKSLGRSLNRLLERGKVVSVTSRMMDFGKQNRWLLRGICHEKSAKPWALAEFRQQLTRQSRLGFQTVVVGYQLAIDPDTMHTCGQGV